MTKLLFTMLIGVPGSGKSTFLKEYLEPFEPSSYAIISTDKYVEKYAQEAGKTYTEVFKDVVKQAENDMNMELHHAILDGKHIFWDQTNLNKKTRAKKLGLIPDFYTKTAVFFRTPPIEVLEARYKNEDRVGKHIPMPIVHGMISNLEEPTLDEGFLDIFTVDNT